MTKYKLEYIWQDGYRPIANLRSKTKVLEMENFNGEVEKLPEWNFDGSSTRQAAGSNSEVVLKPVRAYPDPERADGYLVVAETLNPDGVGPLDASVWGMAEVLYGSGGRSHSVTECIDYFTTAGFVDVENVDFVHGTLTRTVGRKPA